MAQGVHQITADFEAALCKYTGSPYAVALDNMSNALFLALQYELNVRTNVWNSDRWRQQMQGPLKIDVPRYTYPSVPCEVIHAGGKVNFVDFENTWPITLRCTESKFITGAYQLYPTNVWDSALRFTYNMYQPGTHMCLSFTGPYKHLKLGKGGAILTDDETAYKWFKKARFSGRDECSYHEDNFDENPVIGWNFYMMPEIAARGLLLMAQFYEPDGTRKHNSDLSLPYPDLSKFKIYNQ